MIDYATMYKKLFQAQTAAIEILQKAQQETEEMFISGEEQMDFCILDPKNRSEKENSPESDC